MKNSKIFIMICVLLVAAMFSVACGKPQLSSCELTITVLDEKGAPLADAILEYDGYRYLTSQQGKACITVPFEDVTVEFSK